jgi:cytoskeleton protein RodZ
VGSFGDKLRRERETRGITLDQIATVTKVGTRSLKALEDENFAILPGGIFNKGFVRSYAKFLGLNEEQAVADYQAAVKEQPISVKVIAQQSAIAKANRLAAQQARESRNPAGKIRALVFLTVSAAIAYGGYKAYRRGYFHAFKRPSLHRQLKQQAQVVPPAAIEVAAQPTQTQPSLLPTTAPSPAKASQATAPQATAIAPEFTVSIKASDSCWMSIAADGNHPTQHVFSPNEQQAITAKSRVRIIIGNPSGAELSLNGRPLELGGDLSHPRTVVVDATGLASE